VTVLQGLRAIPRQRFRARDPEGGIINLTLKYSLTTRSWFLDVEHSLINTYNIRVSFVPNLLEQHTNVIPWGITVLSQDRGEPFLINDFSTERIRLAVLNAAEVQQNSDLYLEGS
jgi:hypothetical protein